MSSYSNLKFELIFTGQQAGVWGSTTNTNIGTAIEEAITGQATITFEDSNLELDYIDSNASQPFRNLVLKADSSVNLSATRDLIIPNTQKQYFVFNNTTGGQSIRIKTDAGTGVTIPNGKRALVYCDAVNTVQAFNYLDTLSLSTLEIGTQANKATISYTTNEARTLTVPAVSGNRTFAFLEEAQTFTANQTVGANFILSGNARRVQGPTTSLTIADRLFFQDSAADTPTLVNVMPNGIADTSGFLAYNSSVPGDSSYAALYVDGVSVKVLSGVYGSGTYLPMTFFTSGSERMRIDTSGRVGIGVNNPTVKLQVDGQVSGKFTDVGTNTAAQDLSTNHVSQVTISTDTTLTTTVPAAGSTAYVIIVASGTTSRTVTFGSGFASTGTLATGTVPTVRFVVTFISDGTRLIETDRTSAISV